MIQFRDLRAAASLRHRIRAKITVLVCEQKPILVWFSCWRETYSVKFEHSRIPYCVVKTHPNLVFLWH